MGLFEDITVWKRGDSVNPLCDACNAVWDLKATRFGFGCWSLPWAMHAPCLEMQEALVALPEFLAIEKHGCVVSRARVPGSTALLSRAAL